MSLGMTGGDATCKVLVVDDDAEVASLVQFALNPERYITAVATDGLSAIRLAEVFRPDVILLDMMMPGMSGFETLLEIREHWDMPVLMLSAVGDESWVVQCLEAGADDYLNKPFGLRELRARIRATLRRAGARTRQATELISVGNGEVIVNVATGQVLVRGDVVDLAPLEHKLLMLLVQNEGRVLTKEYLLRSIWGPGFEDAGSCLKACVARLRAKIEEDPASPRFIQSRWGVGYYLQSY